MMELAGWNQLLASGDFPTGPGLGKEAVAADCPLGQEPAAGTGCAQDPADCPHIIDRRWQTCPGHPLVPLSPTRACLTASSSQCLAVQMRGQTQGSPRPVCRRVST